ncbi:MAG: M1 family peptidase, partial [Bacteroidetes bacterium]|nr:M1 family peptidase [Bacteroidota bacterium]
MRHLFCAILCSVALGFSSGQAQSADWQQKVDYVMDIDMDAKNHQYVGKQTLIYTNNSPDTLYRVFYHLYFNAFQ